MGLDMYIEGICDGERIEIAYWRKHPNLHGYIVNEFAGGVDECQEIYLTIDDLKKILSASEEDKLPITTGFFFGVSEAIDRQYTYEQLKNVIYWAETHPTWKVYYLASW